MDRQLAKASEYLPFRVIEAEATHAPEGGTEARQGDWPLPLEPQPPGSRVRSERKKTAPPMEGTDSLEAKACTAKADPARSAKVRPAMVRLAKVRPAKGRVGTSPERGATEPDVRAAGLGAAGAGLGKKIQLRPRTLVIAALAVLVLSALCYLLIPPSLRLKAVEVRGNATLDPKDVVAAAALTPGCPLLSVDTDRVRTTLESWAPVEKAEVTVVFPDRIRLSILERRPVAWALTTVGGKSVTVAIDREGVAFSVSYRGSGAAGGRDLPVLSGIRFENWQAGQRLPSFLLPSLRSIVTVMEGDATLLSLFSEIRVERSQWGEVELVLFPLHHAAPVRMGATLDTASLRSVILVLDALSKGGLDGSISEIDFRTGNIVFRTKGGHPG
ncbi:MAG: FtsQ-type POTRA domain-containing protein [Spirochaetota bacterium]